MIRTFNKYALILVMYLYVFNHNAFGHCYDYIATAWPYVNQYIPTL
jgi:hypothetical protein